MIEIEEIKKYIRYGFEKGEEYAYELEIGTPEGTREFYVEEAIKNYINNL